MEPNDRRRGVTEKTEAAREISQARDDDTTPIGPPARMGGPKPASEVVGRLMDTVAYSGIQTVYRGIEFRSRLEARWAAFFDQCQWPWVYEPFDLAGWIPDFLLGKKLLVEIKPFTTFDEFADAVHKSHRAMHCCPTYELLLLGVAPFCDSYTVSLGWIGEIFGGDWDFDRTAFGKPYKQVVAEFNDRYVLCAMNLSYQDRISGVWSGNDLYPNDDWDDTQRLWAEACNLTKWKPDGR